MVKTTVKISGMTCMHCVMHVKKALKDLNGVQNLDVQIVAATIESEQAIDIGVIKGAVEEAGYEVVAVG